MSNLWAEYLQERLEKNVCSVKDGFAVYSFLDFQGEKAVYIEDIFVRPASRKSNVATFMADSIGSLAKERGCTVMLGSVAPNAKFSTRSMKVLLAYGMDLSHIDAHNNLIIFKKALK